MVPRSPAGPGRSAERKAGKMLGEIPRSEGGRPPNNSSHSDEFYYSIKRNMKPKVLHEAVLV